MNKPSEPLPDLLPAHAGKPTPAPAWVAFVAAWLGLLTLISAIVLPLLPGSRHPKQELEHLERYSLADRFLPFPIYACTVTLFLSIIVLWQMRREPVPRPEAMVAQRLQAWVGMILALLAAAIVYIWVALKGPR